MNLSCTIQDCFVSDLINLKKSRTTSIFTYLIEWSVFLLFNFKSLKSDLLDSVQLCRTFIFLNLKASFLVLLSIANLFWLLLIDSLLIEVRNTCRTKAKMQNICHKIERMISKNISSFLSDISYAVLDTMHISLFLL
jgi:hypothetical protein